MKVKKNIIYNNLSLFDALQRLQKIQNKTLIIVKKNLKFLGTLTDGDIRRALLRKIKITDSVQNIINHKSIITYDKKYSETVDKKFKKFKISLLPIIDKDKKYLGFHEFKKDKISQSQFIIMAGGFGRRLGSITKKIPKALVKVKQKPLLEHILSKAKRENFEDIKIITYYKSELIKKFLISKSYKNVKIYKEKRLMGTIGGIKKIATGSNHNLNYLITNCDILTRVSYKSILNFHISSNADLTVATQMKIVKSQFGNVHVDKKNITKFEEKPEHIENIVIGIYVLKKSTVELLKKFRKNKIDMPDFINFLIKKKKKIVPFPFVEKWFDIGNIKNLNDAKKNY
jgi:dTDP-glucose pyrophosphorylase